MYTPKFNFKTCELKYEVKITENATKLTKFHSHALTFTNAQIKSNHQFKKKIKNNNMLKLN